MVKSQLSLLYHQLRHLSGMSSSRLTFPLKVFAEYSSLEFAPEAVYGRTIRSFGSTLVPACNSIVALAHRVVERRFSRDKWSVE